MKDNHLIDLLKAIPPTTCDYQEWVNVGMALKYEGYTANDWDVWSQADERYKPGECFRKWESFNGDAEPVTGGTIYKLACDRGYKPPEKSFDDGRGELSWDSVIKYDNDYKIIDKDWLQGKELHEPLDTQWQPVKELIRYLETLFESTENVGYVTTSWEVEDKEGKTKHMPTRGSYDRTAGELIQALTQCNGDIGAVLGDYNPEVGAWIRFNPLDGKGIKDDNVTDYRYALVESDGLSVDKQNAILRELELPIATLTYSGNKSLHAIIKVDAADYKQYKERVDYLFKVMDKNGFNTDKSNKNPSRLSRMPGVIRNGHKQYLVDTNIGKSSWEAWYEWIEDLNDELPDPESLAETWDNMPDLAPELIRGVLRQGHKMLLAGPSKAGKSFALIELSIAIAEGTEWLGWPCAQGRVLYVNLELDRASALHRFKDVYETLELNPKSIENIDIWNLRGKTVPMDKLAPKLIRRAHKKGYIAVIIDPIYKVLTGDENSADQMAHFTNQFDKVATELGASVIYCHHHSKGAQGGKKSMDRASGSGVFARDPDALIDLIELEIDEEQLQAIQNSTICEAYRKVIFSENHRYYSQYVMKEHLTNQSRMKEHLRKAFDDDRYYAIVDETRERANHLKYETAWRIEGTLREFAKFPPKNIWFSYPIHRLDTQNLLKDTESESETPNWKKAQKAKKTPKERQKEQNESLETAIQAAKFSNGEDKIALESICEYLGVSEKTVRRRVKDHGGYYINGNMLYERKH